MQKKLTDFTRKKPANKPQKPANIRKNPQIPKWRFLEI